MELQNEGAVAARVSLSRNSGSGIPKGGYACSSVVFPPRVLTFHAPEESNLAFISRPQLAQPPFCRIMTAIGAPYTGGGKRPGLLRIVDDGDLLFHATRFLHHTFVAFDLTDVAALPALQLAAG